VNEVRSAVSPEDERRERSLRLVGHISYALHAVVAVGAIVPSLQPGIALLLVAFVIDLVKRGAAAGTWQASHFRWRIRSVVWAGALYVLTLPLWLLLLLPGWIAWVLISLWFLYRVARGWMNLRDRLPMPT